MPKGIVRKLTDEEIQKIKNEYQKGILSKKEILKKYKIGCIYANKILKDVKKDIKSKRRINKASYYEPNINNLATKPEKIEILNKMFKEKWSKLNINSNIKAIYRRRKDSYCDYKQVFTGEIKTKNRNFLTFFNQGKINTITFSDFLTGDVKIYILN